MSDRDVPHSSLDPLAGNGSRRPSSRASVTCVLAPIRRGAVSVDCEDAVVVSSLGPTQCGAGKLFEKQWPVVSCQLTDKAAQTAHRKSLRINSMR